MAKDEAPAAESLPKPYFQSPDGRFRLYQADCLDLMPRMPSESFDLIFADPPYFLSNDGITCHAGKMVSVNKGKWDRSEGPEANHEFNLRWLAACRRLLKPKATLWVSGTSHIIHSIGYAMQCLGFKILNDITWEKTNPPPNLSCRYFTHATETVLWAARDKKSKHTFNYALMKQMNRGKQMKSVWHIGAPRREEKVFGKHPTQKPLALLERIVLASTEENAIVLDPFSGSATTGLAAIKLGRHYAGLETDEDFLNLAIRRFVGVPQADSPSRILELLRAYADGEATVCALANRLRITPRQVHYYKEAAAVLGLLARSQNKWSLTPDATHILLSNKNAARVLLAETILQTPIVQMAVSKTRRIQNEARRREVIAQFLGKCTMLGAATCRRRAQTLMAWIRWANGNVSRPEVTLQCKIPQTCGSG